MSSNVRMCLTVACGALTVHTSPGPGLKGAQGRGQDAGQVSAKLFKARNPPETGAC